MRYLRFKDLQQRNIVRNWTTLARLIREQHFPAGVRIGAQARAWKEAEVDGWLQSRQIATPQKPIAQSAPEPRRPTPVAPKSSAAVQHGQSCAGAPNPGPRSLAMKALEDVPRR
jgi:predicted DNA-binding transcriptional regulator AlpA